MSKEKTAQVSFFSELFQPGLYKRNQGRVARQVTFAVLAITVLLGAWRLGIFLSDTDVMVRSSVSGAVLLIGWWICYRVVNMPRFADFLISVEGEMAKVSWPGRTELFRSSMVVILTIIFLAAILFTYDLLWNELLKLLGVLS